MVLTDEQINSIESKVSDVLLFSYGSDSLEDINPPIDLVAIANSCGLTVKSGHFEDERISGVYDRENNEIYIAEEDSDPRKQFTIAHELGHHVLHSDHPSEVYYRSSAMELDTEQQKEETEANWFAASLLMPRALLIKAWLVYQDFDKIADLFKVSRTTAYFRLKNLGLIA